MSRTRITKLLLSAALNSHNINPTLLREKVFLQFIQATTDE